LAESFVDIDSLLRRSLDKLAAKVLGQVTTFVHSDLSFIFQIALVGDNNDRESILILDSKNLLVEGRDFLKRVAGSDGIHQKEAFSGAHVLLPHRTGVIRDIE
jgi:hypothetical protein